VPRIHPTAIVDPEAQLGPDVSIGPYSVIGPHVRLGAGTTIGPHVLIEGHTSIGEGNQIFHGAALGSAPQDFAYHGEESYLRIGDRNMIREFVTMQPGTGEGGVTSVGSDNMIMAYVHIAHNCRVGDHCILANAVTLAGFVEVQDWVVVGGITPIHQFVRIGCHAIIGGASRIPQDVAPYTKVVGNPPKAYGLNVIGLERRGFSAETVAALKQAYRLFFRSKLVSREAAARIQSELPKLPEIERFVAFVSAQGRGITR
jgi:UDP-N-acetylglucosamine acyltransferase